MHAARLESSERLQALLAFLDSCGDHGATGAEIWEHCRMLNPGTYCSELNRNFERLGIPRRVDCRRVGTTAGRRLVFRYSLINLEGEQRELFRT